MVLLTMVLTKYALINSIFFSDISLKNYTLIHTSYLGITLTHYQFTLFAFSILCITAGGYIINDIFDIETDKINKPLKLIVENSISKKKAYVLYFSGSLLGLFIGTFLSFTTDNKAYSFFFLGTILALFLYSKYLKKTLLVGNLLISILLGLVVFITVLFNEPKAYNSNLLEVISNTATSIQLLLITSTYVVFSILTNIIREIIKDIEDVNGDYKIKAKTLPILLGRKRASKVAFFFSAVLLILLLIVIQSLVNEYLIFSYGILFIILPLIYFMYKLWEAETKREFTQLSTIMKIIMLFGILSMVLFRLN